MSRGNVSGERPLDPCREWLGISALDLDDPQKLLALESIDDPIRILQAAEVRLARLAAVDAGPYEVARRALVARVEEARDRLLAAANDLPARPTPPGSLAMPPSPTASPEDSYAPSGPVPFAAPVAVTFSTQAEPQALPVFPGHTVFPGQAAQQAPVTHAPVPYAPVPQPPVPQPPVSYAPATHDHLPYAPAAHDHVPHDGLGEAGPTHRPAYRRSSSDGPLLLLVGALFTVIVGLGLFATQSPPPNPESSRPPPKRPTVKRPVGKPTTTARRDQYAVRERPTSTREDDGDEPSPPVRMDQPDALPEAEPDDQPVREPEVATTTRQPAIPVEPEPMRDPPMPAKPDPPPTDAPDPVAQIDDAVKRAFEALSQRDYETAEQVMKKVEPLAPQPREAKRIAGWLQLAAYAKGFQDYRKQAIDAMKPGREYDVKSKKIAVVEVNDREIMVKLAGQLKTWPRDDIPGAVLQTILETWFDANPANQIYLGAYHFTKPEPNFEQAEACWNKANAGGADASLLIPLLTDPVVVDAAGP